MTKRIGRLTTMANLSLRNAIYALTLALSAPAIAQLSVSPQTDLQALAASIAGPGVRIANPVIDCHSEGFGEFAYSGSVLGLEEGVLLTSGRITNAVGPNTVSNRTFEQNTPGSPLLNSVTGRTTYDACKFEFDIIPSGDTLSFNFVLGSEEYNEWVGSQYNDVFGFFISGPGIVGDPGIGNDHNIALIPGTTQPVTINTVNNASNNTFFLDNTGGQHIQYDGVTRDLKAVSAVQPCQTYHLKLIVADASDRKFDSGVFIERIESNSVTMQSFTASGLTDLIEGCDNSTVRFTRQTVTANALDVPYFLTGDAINGSDYPLIGSDPDPAVAKVVTIPANQASADVVIAPFADGLAEGVETLRIYLGTSICPGFYIDSLEIDLRDSLDVSISAPTSICTGNSSTLSASGGLNYAWSPALGLDDPTSASPVATPATTTTYLVTISAANCTQVRSTTILVSSISLAADVVRPLCNGDLNGAINLSISGGIAPYSISWTGPNGYTALTEDLANIGAGSYVATVSDGAGCSAVLGVNVSAPAPLTATITPSILPFGQNISCSGGNTGTIALVITGGTAPYAILWNGPNGFTSSAQNLNGLVAGTYDLTITDVRGCQFSAQRTLTEPPPIDPTIQAIQAVSCFGAEDGTATVGLAGGMPPFVYSWNSVPQQNGATASGLATGAYTVTITDGYNCITQTNVTIEGPSEGLAASITNIVDVDCFGATSGEATAVVNGGTAPYTYIWNSDPQLTNAAVSGLAGGPIEVEVTDANGCATVANGIIGSPSDELAVVIVDVVDIACSGNAGGSATAIAAGGTGPYSFTWGTSPVQNTEVLSAEAGGTYTLQVTDALGCITSTSVTIEEPAVPLEATISASSNVLCVGDGQGSATVAAAGGTAPYTFSWDTTPAQTNATAVGLEAGTYTVTVTDANNCTTTRTASIQGPSDALSVTITAFTNILCLGSVNGSATAIASGGTGPYTYSWNTSPAQQGEQATDLLVGTYTVTALDANGCSATTSVTINNSTEPITAYFESYGPETCFGAMDGFATVNAFGASNSFTFTWNTTPPIVGATATGLAPGDYLVEIVDNNGCDTPKYLPITIDGADAPLAVTMVVNDALCAGSNDGTVDLTITGGYSPYFIQWSDPISGQSTGIEDLTDLGPGAYDLLVTDANGCQLDTSIVIMAPPALTISTTITALTCASADQAAISSAVAGGSPGYTLEWTGPDGFTATTTDIQDLMPGVYVLTATDQNNCTVQSTVTIAAAAPPTLETTPSVFNGGFNLSCAGGSDGAIDLTVIGGNAPYIILWTDGLGFTSAAEDITDLPAGVYTVTVQDQNGCEATTSVTLNGPPSLDLSAVASVVGDHNVSCAGALDGSVDLTVVGGVAPYTFTWNNGASTEDIAGIGFGTYTATVTDMNGCTAAISITLTAPPALNAELSTSLFPGGTAVSCPNSSDGSITTVLSGGTAPYTAGWSGPDGFTSTDLDLTGLVAGTYTLLVSDANSCQTTSSVLLSAPQPMEVLLGSATYNGGYNIGCHGGATGSIGTGVLGGQQGYTYVWSGPNGFTANSADLTGLTAGTYTVLVTDANGCDATATIDLTEAPALDVVPDVADLGGGFNTTCANNDGSINLSIVGGTPVYAISWSGPAGFNASDTAISGLASGTYNVVVSDANGCSFQSSFVLTAPPSIEATLTATPGLCPGDDQGDIALTVQQGTAPYSYAWSGPAGSTYVDAELTDVPDGPYTVLITDALGCNSTFTIDLTGPAPISAGSYVSFYGVYNLQCEGDSTGVIELSPTGGQGPYGYTITGPGGSTYTTPALQGLVAGTYAISIVDVNGCALDTTITLTQPINSIDATLDLSVYPSGTNVSCFGASDGWIDATITGGSGPYEFFWRGPDSLEFSTEDIFGLPAGEYAYELVVTDANQCSFFTNIVLTQPDSALYASTVVSAFGDANTSCSDATDGSILLSVGGGNGSYTYAWQGPGGFTSASQNLSDLIAGTYTVTVTDINGCDLVDVVTLVAPDPLTIAITPLTYAGGTNISCHGADDGQLTATVSGGTPTYTISWSGPDGFSASTALINGLAPGTYCLSATDLNGCSTQACITIAEPDVLVASTNATADNCGLSTGSIDLSITGGTAPFAYAWSNGQTQEDLAGLVAGSYSAMISDANGCATNITVVITGTPAVSITAEVGNDHCAGAGEGAIDLTVLSGSAPFTFSWSNSANTEDIAGLLPGAYEIVVMDANGCEAQASYTVSGNSPIVIDTVLSSYIGGYNISSWQESNGSISTAVSGGSAPYSYSWSNGGTGSDISGLPAGTYTLVVTDVNGCTASIVVTLTEPSDLEMPTGFTPNGDGANETFFIRGLDAYPSNALVIINRWGNVIYDRVNYRNDWNGESIQGGMLPDGTYFAILTVNDGQRTLQGYVDLRR